MSKKLRLVIIITFLLLFSSLILRAAKKTKFSSSLFSRPPGATSPTKDELVYLSDQVLGEKIGAVLAAADETTNVTFNIPAIFKENAYFNKDVVIQGKISASNILYGLTGGSGITLSDGQNPRIENIGVLSLQGKSGQLALEAGDGIVLDGLKIANEDKGSSQNIFKTIKIGSTEFSASSNTDTLTFSAGEGVSLSVDAANKKIILSQSGAAAGYQAGAGLVLSGSQFLINAPTCSGNDKLVWNGTAFVCAPDINTNTTYSAGDGLVLNANAFALNIPLCLGQNKLQWNGSAFVCTPEEGSSNPTAPLDIVATRSGTLASFVYDGTQILGINTNGDITIGGKITMKEDDVNLAGGNDVFVYETSKDFDGGAWTNSDKVQGSSWYNETIDHTTSECSLADDDRCGRRAFPKRAIVMVTDNNILIFDGQENSLWIKVNKGEGLASGNTGTTFTSVYGRDGIIYVGTSKNGLLAFNFVEDKIYQYDYNQNSGGRAMFQGAIADRNTNRGYGAKAAWGKIASDKVFSVHAQVINNKTYIAVSTLGGVSVINPADQRVVRYIDSN